MNLLAIPADLFGLLAGALTQKVAFVGHRRAPGFEQQPLAAHGFVGDQPVGGFEVRELGRLGHA